MKRNLCLLMFLGILLLSPAVAWADGDIYVGGPWGTKINKLPYTISTPGAYYLGGNLSSASGGGITITSDHVTLDLMGFNLSGPGDSTGIFMSGRTNVEIRNGTITNWYTGILESSRAALCHRILNVRLSGCNYSMTVYGNGHLIKSCEVAGPNLVRGFFIDGYGTINGCLAQGYSNEGIWIGDGGVPSGGIISGNVLIGDGTGQIGIYSGNGTSFLSHSLILGNEVNNCGSNGISFWAGTSVIGNTVNTSATGQIGIYGNNDSATVLDQNTVMGTGTKTANIGNAKTRNNAW